MYDCSVTEILRDFPLMSHYLKERRQMIHELRVTMLVDLSRNRVRFRSGLFPAVELSHGPGGFVERGRELEVGVGLHLRQPGDGGVEDGGEAVEDDFEGLGPSL
nr:unnamed protein product [Spirometra erinaceieuropaei]